MTGSFATDMCDASGALLLDGAKRAMVARDRGGLRHSAEPAAAGARRHGRVRPAEGRGGAGLGPAARHHRGGRVRAMRRRAPSPPAPSTRATPSSRSAPPRSISWRGRAITRRREHLIHTFCHGLPGRWFQMAALLNGAGALAWAAGLLGRSDIGQLLAETEQAFTGPLARAVPALSLGRADAAQQPPCQGRAVRAHARHRRPNR